LAGAFFQCETIHDVVLVDSNVKGNRVIEETLQENMRLTN
jgi:hypothetical protein